jgi:3-deoxy-manno-octulosonate cytidylyltransferase (CMP-KDO synthetase)
MSSSRFPGKPVLDLMGITMMEHVWRRTKLSDVDEVYFALCDKETETVCKKIGAKYVITKKTHQMCMDRVAEASKKIETDIVVTVQGDEPLITPSMINLTIKNIFKKNIFCTTLAQKIVSQKEINNPNRVKLVMNKNNEAMYISRSRIPANIKYNKRVDYYKMVCVYTMKMNNLNKFQKFGISKNEEIESIDMLRVLDNCETLGINVINGIVENIDTREDIKPVLKLLKKDSLTKNYIT